MFIEALTYKSKENYVNIWNHYRGNTIVIQAFLSDYDGATWLDYNVKKLREMKRVAYMMIFVIVLLW